jgi:hypothetical protein
VVSAYYLAPTASLNQQQQQQKPTTETSPFNKTKQNQATAAEQGRPCLKCAGGGGRRAGGPRSRAPPAVPKVYGPPPPPTHTLTATSSPAHLALNTRAKEPAPSRGPA